MNKKRVWGKPRTRLRELLDMNLCTIKVYLFKEDFDHLWTYNSVTWANKFINEWTRDVMRHRSLPELKKFARMIRKHQELILNYFRAKKEFSSPTNLQENAGEDQFIAEGAVTLDATSSRLMTALLRNLSG